MGAQPDTSTSAPEVCHGVQPILAPVFVPRLLATYLAPVPHPHQPASPAHTHARCRAVHRHPTGRVQELLAGATAPGHRQPRRASSRSCAAPRPAVHPETTKLTPPHAPG